jgi:UPF0755 protein
MTDLSVWTEGDRPTRSSKRHRRRRKKDRRGGFAVALALVLVLVIVGAGAAVALGAGSKLKNVFHSTAAGDYPGPGSGSVQVQVVSGQSVAEIGRTLKSKGVIKTIGAFLQVANADPNSSSVQPGFYKFRTKMTASDALATLLDPSARIQARVTLPEGLRLDETLKKLSKDGKLPMADLVKALKNAKALGLPAYAKNNPEGFLFPATYDVPPDATAQSVLKQLFASYAAAADKAGVAHTNRTPYEIVIIASLVEAEARNPGDYGKVARVVYNRLTQGMPLQFDSTINYALNADKQLVTNADLGVNSPYNTYKHKGLPPGPVNSPGLAALQAAVNPTAGNWLYFVTTNPKTGETKFTADYKQFLAFKAELKSNQ